MKNSHNKDQNFIYYVYITVNFVEFLFLIRFPFTLCIILYILYLYNVNCLVTKTHILSQKRSGQLSKNIFKKIGPISVIQYSCHHVIHCVHTLGDFLIFPIKKSCFFQCEFCVMPCFFMVFLVSKN